METFGKYGTKRSQIPIHRGEKIKIAEACKRKKKMMKRAGKKWKRRDCLFFPYEAQDLNERMVTHTHDKK